MKIELRDGRKFPLWTVQRFFPKAQTATYFYRKGLLVDVQYKVFWGGLTGTYSWMDPDDRRQLQAERPFLKRAEDLESLGGPNESADFILHAVDDRGRPVLVVLNNLDNYGIQSF